jgi:hypothetical protein
MSLAAFDSFKEICDGLGLSEQSKVAVLRVYGDAGGNRNQTNVAVGAYIGTVIEWDAAFRPLWNAELKKEGVECFHRSEMEPPFHGEFKKKAWTKEHVLVNYIIALAKSRPGTHRCFARWAYQLSFAPHPSQNEASPGLSWLQDGQRIGSPA